MLSLADLFRVHADKCIRTALNRRDLKEVASRFGTGADRSRCCAREAVRGRAQSIDAAETVHSHSRIIRIYPSATRKSRPAPRPLGLDRRPGLATTRNGCAGHDRNES